MSHFACAYTADSESLFGSVADDGAFLLSTLG